MTTAELPVRHEVVVNEATGRAVWLADGDVRKVGDLDDVRAAVVAEFVPTLPVDLGALDDVDGVPLYAGTLDDLRQYVVERHADVTFTGDDVDDLARSLRLVTFATRLLADFDDRDASRRLRDMICAMPPTRLDEVEQRLIAGLSVLFDPIDDEVVDLLLDMIGEEQHGRASHADQYPHDEHVGLDDPLAAALR